MSFRESADISLMGLPRFARKWTILLEGIKGVIAGVVWQSRKEKWE